LTTVSLHDAVPPILQPAWHVDSQTLDPPMFAAWHRACVKRTAVAIPVAGTDQAQGEST
jgi:hypothetical protein